MVLVPVKIPFFFRQSPVLANLVSKCFKKKKNSDLHVTYLVGASHVTSAAAVTDKASPS